MSEFIYTWNCNISTCRALNNYLRDINPKQIWICLNVEAIKLFKKEEKGSLISPAFFRCSTSSGFQNFRHRVVLEKHRAQAPTFLVSLVFRHLIEKAPAKKKKVFQLYLPSLGRFSFTQSSFIPSHQISNHRIVDIINIRSLIYKKTFPQSVKSLNLRKKYQFSHTRFAKRLKKKTNKRTNKFALIWNQTNNERHSRHCFPLIS